MSRLQLALNVDNFDESVEFYSKLFATKPNKTKPGYANFIIENPPLKLVLFQGSDGHTINHLGVEVDSAAEVTAAEQRLSDDGLETTGVDETLCCYAEKTETWVHGPDGSRWEWYVKTDDAEGEENRVVRSHSCCP